MNNKITLCFLFILLSLIFVTIGVSAKESGFSMYAVLEKEAKSVLNRIDLTFLTEEPPKEAINCFDVNENGLFVVGCETGMKKTVCVYSYEGIFQFGYSFVDAGSIYVELFDDYLAIYTVRGSLAIVLDFTGNVEKILAIINTPHNNQYWYYLTKLTSKETKSAIFKIRNDMGFLFNLFASDYSQVVVKEANGEEKIIYDVNSGQFAKKLTFLIGLIIFVAIVVFCIVKWFPKTNPGKTGGRQGTARKTGDGFLS